MCDGKVKSSCSLWRLVEESDGTDVSQLEHVVDLDLQGNNVRWFVVYRQLCGLITGHRSNRPFQPHPFDVVVGVVISFEVDSKPHPLPY